MRGIAFIMAGAAMLLGSARGALTPDFVGFCQANGNDLTMFGTEHVGASPPVDSVMSCFAWCEFHLPLVSVSLLRGVNYNNQKCYCSIDFGSMSEAALSYDFYDFGTPGTVGPPTSGNLNPFFECYVTILAAACPINLLVGIDQTSMIGGDTSVEDFTTKLFELTDEMPIGPDGALVEVAFLQGHKQNGNKHLKQISTAMPVAASMGGVVDPRDYVTETEVIRRPRTPFIAFMGTVLDRFESDIDDDTRQTFCLIFTNKGDIGRKKDRRDIKQYAKNFKETMPCIPICYQNSREADGPSYMARVLCSDELSFYSDTFDGEALAESICTIPEP